MFSVDVEKSFLRGKKPFTLRVAFESDSRTLVIFGPSGSGKSLTLQLMAGMIAPDQGRIMINGHVLFDSGGAVNLPARKRRIGYVFQDYALFPHMSVRKNIAFGLAPAIRTDARARPATPSTSSWPASRSRTSPTACRGGSPAGRSNAWPWLGR